MRFGDYDKTLSEMSEVTRGMYMRYTVYINMHGGSEKKLYQMFYCRARDKTWELALEDRSKWLRSSVNLEKNGSREGGLNGMICG